MKKDRRQDGRSPFGPPGQLAKREQPGTGNEEERRMTGVSVQFASILEFLEGLKLIPSQGHISDICVPPHIQHSVKFNCRLILSRNASPNGIAAAGDCLEARWPTPGNWISQF
ncbi:hypothetical protein DUI87_19577 [Hirundo rustica rustica]|uniref:Uncharacterized protein n=1 Tax=Hirundo rustica rustica TaxID=333673 RepID=A0A3M0JXH2_HIRRU|nr:hypothetical protein DUI87_19577 [Hirundo rustica rustica]